MENLGKSPRNEKERMPDDTIGGVMAKGVIPSNQETPRFQFSIRRMMVFVLIASLALLSVVAHLRFRQLQVVNSELRERISDLRRDMGSFEIEDENKVYIRQLIPSMENEWKWRIFLPKGYEFSLRMESLGLTGTNFPRYRRFRHNSLGLSYGESTITARLYASRSGEWKLQCFDKFSIVEELNTQIDFGELYENGVVMTPDSGLGLRGGRTVCYSPSQRMELLRNRLADEHELDEKPRPGLLIWIEPGVPKN